MFLGYYIKDNERTKNSFIHLNKISIPNIPLFQHIYTFRFVKIFRKSREPVSAYLFSSYSKERKRRREREKGGKKRGKGGSGFLRSVPFNYPSVFYFKKPPPPFSRTMTFRIPLAING